MARRSKKATQRRLKKKIISAIIAIIIALIGAFVATRLAKDETPDYEIPEGSVEYHFIDIGQGDAELILVGDKAILIDSGENGKEEREKLVNYLAKYNVTELEYFVATHPDSDHIGSADYVINNYKVNNVILSPKEHTSNTYERMITAIENKVESGEIKNVYIAGYDDCPLGTKLMVDELEMTILGPVDPEDYRKDDNNNPSVVIMARWGKTKVLLTGDAEKEAEIKLVEKYGSQLDCDILKVGHHGSHSSTHQADPSEGISFGFLHYVKPTVAVISCGEGNKYGHPHKETLDELSANNVEIIRTDLEGSIVFVSDGETMTRKTEQ